MPVGFTEGLTFDERRSNWTGDGPRPLKWCAWYPAIDSAQEQRSRRPSWFQFGPVARDAPLRRATKPYRIIMLSHGTGGVAHGLEWLGRRLAQSGFVALAVDHHGNTGSEPYCPEGFLCLWERASDLSALLDDAQWRHKIGGEFVAHACVAGFSAGAYAAMLLMGARVAYSQFEAGNPEKSPVSGPKEFANLADEIPRLLDRSAVFRASWERRSANYTDDRFLAALALAPGRSVRGFSPESLSQISRPVRITVGDGDRVAPAAECSGWLHERLPGSEFEVIGSAAGHYVFLPTPTPLGLEEASDVFTDPQGVDRGAVHDRVSSTAVRFFGNAR